MHRAFYGPLLLLVWQAAPFTVERDRGGRVRFYVGYGTEGYSSTARTVSCDGSTIRQSQKNATLSGPSLEAEVWPTDGHRVSVFASERSGTVTSSYASPVRHVRKMRGGMVAAEGAEAGVGLGVAWITGTEVRTVPLAYLRIGSIEGWHGRIDLVPASLPAGRVVLRGGVGYNLGLGSGRARSSLMLGRSIGRGIGNNDEGGVTAFGDLIVPLARRHVEMRLAGRFGLGSMNHDSVGSGPVVGRSLEAGLRLSF